MNKKRISVILSLIILIDIFQTKYLYNVETVHVKNLSKQFQTSNSNQRTEGITWRMGQREPEQHVDRHSIPATHDNTLGDHGNHSIMPGDGNMPGSHGNNISGNVSHIFPAIQNNSINMAKLQHKLSGKMTSDKLLQSSKYWKRKCLGHQSKYIGLNLFVYDSFLVEVVQHQMLTF